MLPPPLFLVCLNKTSNIDIIFRFKGSIPYVKQPKAAKKKKTQAKRGPAATPWRTFIPAVAVSAVAVVVFFAWQHAAVLQARLTEGWPTHDHLIHLALGAVLASAANVALG